jgi:putative phage-type endonuclease
MKIIDLEQGSENWHKFRKSHIGASDVPIVMGVSPWCTPHQLWQRKLGLIPEQEENDAMRRGKELECKAREIAEKHFQCKFYPIVGESEIYPWMSASFDGYNYLLKLVIEIKCPSQKDHELASQGKIPEKYIPQLQHQMYVGCLDEIHYMSYRNDLDYHFVKIDRDYEYIQKMLIEEKKFWDCLQNLEAPPLTENDYVDKEQDVSWANLAVEYKKLKNRREELEVLENECKAALLEACQGQNCIGRGLKVSKCLRKGNIDYSQIPYLKNISLENYRGKGVEYWRIS